MTPGVRTAASTASWREFARSGCFTGRVEQSTFGAVSEQASGCNGVGVGVGAGVGVGTGSGFVDGPELPPPQPGTERVTEAASAVAIAAKAKRGRERRGRGKRAVCRFMSAEDCDTGMANRAPSAHVFSQRYSRSMRRITVNLGPPARAILPKVATSPDSHA